MQRWICEAVARYVGVSYAVKHCASLPTLPAIHPAKPVRSQNTFVTVSQVVDLVGYKICSCVIHAVRETPPASPNRTNVFREKSSLRTTIPTLA